MLEIPKEAESFRLRLATLTNKDLLIAYDLIKKECEKRDAPINELELKDNKLYFNSKLQSLAFEYLDGKFTNRNEEGKIIYEFSTINKLFEHFVLGPDIQITKYDMTSKDAMVNTTLIMVILKALSVRNYEIDTKKDTKNGENAITMTKREKGKVVEPKKGTAIEIKN